MSATEWIASASIDAEPVIANATNFEIAIPRLARNAAKIAAPGAVISIARRPTPTLVAMRVISSPPTYGAARPTSRARSRRTCR